MWRSLRGVEEANDLDDQTKVTAELGKIETELSEFRRASLKQKQSAKLTWVMCSMTSISLNNSSKS